MQKLPILYSFRRCPFAIRARMALYYAKVSVELREVVLKNKPEPLLQASSKGTVPVLVLSDGQVIDESIDIIVWALEKHDPEDLLSEEIALQSFALVETNDFVFKPMLDRYKYADRHPELSLEEHRSNCLPFLTSLETSLQQNRFLLSGKPGLTDIALFPFIRQFAFVDKSWFDDTNFSNVQRWLNYWLDCEIFHRVMQKYTPWSAGDKPIIFP